MFQSLAEIHMQVDLVRVNYPLYYLFYVKCLGVFILD